MSEEFTIMMDRQFVCPDKDCQNSRIPFTVSSDHAYCWLCGQKMEEYFEPNVELTPDEAKELLRFLYKQGAWSNEDWPLVGRIHHRLHNLYE